MNRSGFEPPRQHVVGRVVKWIAIAVLLVEGLLVLTGLLDLDEAVIIVLVLEGLCAVVAILMAVTVRVRYRRLVESGRSRQEAFLAALAYVLPRPVVFVLRHELSALHGVWLLLRRRDDVPDGATVLRYGANVRPMLIICSALSVVEIAVVELLLPWQWLRVTLLVLTLYGIVWVLGFLGALRRQPHYVTSRQLVLRFGHLHTLRVDLSAVSRFKLASHHGMKKTVHATDDAVALTVFGATSVAVELDEGSIVEVDGRSMPDLAEVRFDVDDPRDVVAVLTNRLTRSRETERSTTTGPP